MCFHVGANVALTRAVLAASEAGVDGEHSRRLAACDTGYWIITPTGGGYPFYAVSRGHHPFLFLFCVGLLTLNSAHSTDTTVTIPPVSVGDESRDCLKVSVLFPFCLCTRYLCVLNRNLPWTREGHYCFFFLGRWIPATYDPNSRVVCSCYYFLEMIYIGQALGIGGARDQHVGVVNAERIQFSIEYSLTFASIHTICCSPPRSSLALALCSNTSPTYPRCIG